MILTEKHGYYTYIKLVASFVRVMEIIEEVLKYTIFLGEKVKVLSTPRTFVGIATKVLDTTEKNIEKSSIRQSSFSKAINTSLARKIGSFLGRTLMN